MHKLIKIYNKGKVLDEKLYNQLKRLDAVKFPNCGNEFIKSNRAWWVMVDKRKIIAYCGMIYTDYYCLFNRAWVHKDYRGNGIQRLMIKARLKTANKKKVITYTLKTNIVSANNLIKSGFLLYDPMYKYAGDVLYFCK